MNPTLLALYGLKWNPFSPELPTEAVFVSPRVENSIYGGNRSLEKVRPASVLS
jgi:hypothetical protein